MLDRAFIRENLDQVKLRLAAKRFDFDESRFRELDDTEKAVRQEWEELRANRNRTSEAIARAKREGGDTSAPVRQMREVGARIKELDGRLKDLTQQLSDLLAAVPNLPDSSVPVGDDETANLEVRRVGQPRTFDFPVRDHVEIGTALGILDLERASKIAGARFGLYRGVGARLERALIQFMLQVQTEEHGYMEYLPPVMANSRTFFGTGQLPKFEEDLFKIEGSDFYLIPTAEVPLTNLFSGEILEEEDLPLLVTAYTPCFRSEAGAHGRDTRGLIRLHQFNKVELVKFSRPEDSYEDLEKLTSDAEDILKRLELPYRVVTLSSGDMSASSAKTYDLEVWLPSQETYREISSCSNFEDYQARRAGIRYRPAATRKTRFVHTLNGSGLAIGRTWVAIVENYQQSDGSVLVPEVLRPHLGGLEVIAAE